MAAYVPLRLSLTERKQLHLLEGALSVSQYVDKVDDYPYKSRTGRMVAMVREVCALLCGLLVASDYKLGQATIENKNYADNQRLFQTIFEVGRRHKIMNPDKMRANYGKLIFLLQDAQANVSCCSREQLPLTTNSSRWSPLPASLRYSSISRSLLLLY